MPPNPKLEEIGQSVITQLFDEGIERGDNIQKLEKIHKIRQQEKLKSDLTARRRKNKIKKSSPTVNTTPNTTTSSSLLLKAKTTKLGTTTTTPLPRKSETTTSNTTTSSPLPRKAKTRTSNTNTSSPLPRKSETTTSNTTTSSSLLRKAKTRTSNTTTSSPLPRKAKTRTSNPTTSSPLPRKAKTTKTTTPTTITPSKINNPFKLPTIILGITTSVFVIVIIILAVILGSNECPPCVQTCEGCSGDTSCVQTCEGCSGDTSCVQTCEGCGGDTSCVQTCEGCCGDTVLEYFPSNPTFYSSNQTYLVDSYGVAWNISTNHAWHENYSPIYAIKEATNDEGGCTSSAGCSEYYGVYNSVSEFVSLSSSSTIHPALEIIIECATIGVPYICKGYTFTTDNVFNNEDRHPSEWLLQGRTITATGTSDWTTFHQYEVNPPNTTAYTMNITDLTNTIAYNSFRFVFLKSNGNFSDGVLLSDLSLYGKRHIN